ncbi:MAG TPA: DUF4058 family protein [Gemmataceae bacterium]|nr:DUF4058 family protein [Gemmataceae bacterium]
MPLLDHSRPPLRNRPQYKSLNAAWGTFLCNSLNNGGLPPGYRAYPENVVGIGLEADAATYEESAQGSAGNGDGAVATAVWAPPLPSLVVPVGFSDLESIEVKVFDDDGAGRLVAAVELVSPANKDRPDRRSDFAVKCAAYLQNEVSVLVVDIVTERRTNLHRPLMELLHLGEPAASAVTANLYAAAYRVVRAGERTQLEAWLAALALGEPLPKMPLWLRDDLAIPLDLEATYRQACVSVRIPM